MRTATNVETTSPCWTPDNCGLQPVCSQTHRLPAGGRLVGIAFKISSNFVQHTPPNETSARVSEDGRRAEGAQWGRKWRRVATKAKGDDTENWAVLSLVSYLKYNFLSIII
jgi:hypothetical protein